jgi:lysine 2,3-aminomutase
MVKGVEDLRTPLSEIITLDKQIRGTLSGFMMPSFVVDLPGGGGKRLVSTYETYDEATGIATYRAPGLDGQKGKMLYTYNDPKPIATAELAILHEQKAQALENGQTLEQLARSTPFKPSRNNLPSQVPLPALSQDIGRKYRSKNVIAPGASPVPLPLPFEVPHQPYSDAPSAASAYASSSSGSSGLHMT